MATLRAAGFHTDMRNAKHGVSSARPRWLRPRRTIYRRQRPASTKE